jgi:hypothetical protein
MSDSRLDGDGSQRAVFVGLAAALAAAVIYLTGSNAVLMWELGLIPLSGLLLAAEATIPRVRRRFAVRRVRRAAKKGAPNAISGRVVCVLEDRSFLLERSGELFYVHAAWSQPSGSGPLEVRVDDEVSVEGPSVVGATPKGTMATFREAPKLRVFVPSPGREVVVVRNDGTGDERYPGAEEAEEGRLTPAAAATGRSSAR